MWQDRWFAGISQTRHWDARQQKCVDSLPENIAPACTPANQVAERFQGADRAQLPCASCFSQHPVRSGTDNQ